MLSATVRRRLYFYLNGRQEFTNLISLILGQSGISHKTLPMIIGANILRKAVGDIFLPSDTTPEGLLEAIADTITIKKMGKKGKSITVNKNEGRAIRRALCIFWKDEAGQFYAKLNKYQNMDYKDLICFLYDCPTVYDKDLAGVHFCIENIYYGMCLATTPTSFYDQVLAKDVHTGFLARHLIVNPRYSKNWKPIIQTSEQDIKKEEQFADTLKLIDSLLPESSAIWVKLSDACLEMLNTWLEERVKYFAKQSDDVMGSFMSRLQISVLKVALLLELGNVPFYLMEHASQSVNSSANSFANHSANYTNTNQEKNISINIDEIIRKNTVSHTNTKSIDTIYNNNVLSIYYYNYYIQYIDISVHTLSYALKLYDAVYIPYIREFSKSKRETVFANYNQKIYDIIKEHKKIAHSVLLRNSHVDSKRFVEAIETLKEAGAVLEYEVRKKPKNQKVYVFKPESVHNLNFYPPSIPANYQDAKIELRYVAKKYSSQSSSQHSSQDSSQAGKKNILKNFFTSAEKLNIEAQPTPEQQRALDDSVMKMSGLGLVVTAEFQEAKESFYKNKGWTAGLIFNDSQD